ncbi:hypothetical protein [Nibricoccus sp. IMCC34717]|uniref:hypothetical protein n=1 Tax=Nibricoccus sp. IMCC34717 TaxID=3034021 RepID=UPI00384C6808
MENQKVNLPHGGIFVRGIVVSKKARTGVSSKTGKRWVMVVHELATQPGIVEFCQFLDPEKDQGIKIENDRVIQFPGFKDMESISLKVIRCRYERDHLVIEEAERLQ